MNRIVKFVCVGVSLSLTACGGGGSSSPSGSTTSVSTPATYTVGGKVEGLGTAQVVLGIGGSNSSTVSVGSDGTFTFPAALANGASYAVTVQTQPSTPGEQCNVSNSSGNVTSNNVTNVTVTCTTVSGFLYYLVGNQIYSYRIDPGTGIPAAFGQPLAVPNPTSVTLWNRLTASPGGDYLYVDGMSNDGYGNGSVMIYRVDHGTGALTAVGTPVATGIETNVASVTSKGFVFIYAANGMTIGRPGTPAGTPTVQEYAVNTDGTLNLLGTPLTYVANSETKLAVTPDGKFLYTLTNSPSATTPSPLTLTAYSIDPTTGALAAGASVNVGAADLGLTMDPLGRFLYLSTYTGSTFQASAVLNSYAIDSSSGAPTAVGTGTTVQSNVGLLLPDPSGVSLFMANNLNFSAAQDSLQALSVDQTGAITVNGTTMQTSPAGSVPWQMLSESTGRYIYLESQSGSTTNSTLLSTFSVSTAGQLVSAGSPITLPSTSTGSMAYVQGSASGG